MAQCLVTFAVISSIEPSLPITVDGIMDPGLPPHTPYLGTPVVFPPGQRPVSFCFGEGSKWEVRLAALDCPSHFHPPSIATSMRPLRPESGSVPGAWHRNTLNRP